MDLVTVSTTTPEDRAPSSPRPVQRCIECPVVAVATRLVDAGDGHRHLVALCAEHAAQFDAPEEDAS